MIVLVLRVTAEINCAKRGGMNPGYLLIESVDQEEITHLRNLFQ